MYIILAAILISMFLIIVRGITGPTAFDRILAGNSFGTFTVVMISIVSVITNDEMYLDIAMVYALINFITTIAYLRYFKYDSLGETTPQSGEKE